MSEQADEQMGPVLYASISYTFYPLRTSPIRFDPQFKTLSSPEYHGQFQVASAFFLLSNATFVQQTQIASAFFLHSNAAIARQTRVASAFFVHSNATFARQTRVKGAFFLRPNAALVRQTRESRPSLQSLQVKKRSFGRFWNSHHQKTRPKLSHPYEKENISSLAILKTSRTEFGL